ncbi:fumarate reductase/succinate dehydrogenase flavoprotein domain protein [Alkaliphilus metalliredigens QYMF]|uniref:Fumarate reductase/succinate dehydrogenase flavoprotein domain protein n=1 Tax=Alkaliphilus metalliredigens (strain QYMF) TaxID=293826 RepID=A6TUV8_ALKMQ|nr:FAD-dependent oxidoreductase [Alkaliphilus metalliredigens]ABR49976.1 fumarate reductase/succinate dehydrogenase flavoprotein domain protein [Alkaliphilus metalliredigens QYMF]
MLSKKRFLVFVSVLLIVGLLAGCTTSSNPTAKDETDTEGKVIEKDILVIGGGAAGLAAAIEAADEGASVILVEKMSYLGGSTLISAGIMYGAETPIQKQQGITETWEDLAAYWIDMAEGNVDVDLINYIASHSGETFEWLEEQGVEFAEGLSPQGVSPALRGHTPKEGRGMGLIQPLEKTAREKGVEILPNAPATKLLVNDENEIVGAEVDEKGEKIIINAKAVILATGGYDRNPELIAEYAPVANNYTSYSAVGNVGDGLVMAREVGAEIVSKNSVIGFKGMGPDYPYTTPLGGLVFLPGLYVNPNGERFVQENEHYAVVVDIMAKNGYDAYYVIIDKNTPTEIIESGIEDGYGFKGETIEDLAEAIGLPVENLVETVERYNQLAGLGVDEDFGKAGELNVIEEGPYYAVKVTPAMIGSIGGPKVTLEGRVLNPEGNAVKGLFAAGEVANGQLYNEVYPASGTSITMSFTLGRVAGREAAKEVK